MPVVGPPVQVTVTPSPVGGSLILLWNRSGTRREFTVTGKRMMVDGNTRAGVVTVEQPADVVVLEGDQQVWPDPPLD